MSDDDDDFGGGPKKDEDEDPAARKFFFKILILKASHFISPLSEDRFSLTLDTINENCAISLLKV